MMVAKIIIDDQLEIIIYPELGRDLDEIRLALPAMGYNHEGIHILDLQPGIGKTHAVIDFLGSQNSFLVVTGTHKLLESEYEKLGVMHWESFPKMCEEYSKVKNMHSLGVPIHVICEFQCCEKHKCPYWTQFDHPKAIAPYHFLDTNRVREGHHFKYDMLVVDEAMTGYKSITVDLNELKGTKEIISKYISTSELDALVELMDKGEDTFDFIQRNIKDINKAKYASLKSALAQEEWDDVKKISSLNVSDLRKFAYYRSIHEEITTYDEPRFYEIFDLARQGVPIILIDASFDMDLFLLLYGRYAYEDSKKSRSLLTGKELKPLQDIKISVYESHIQQKERKIYRMDKDNFYYKKGLLNQDKELTENGKRTIEQLKSFILRTKRKYPNVGIITYKELIPHFSVLGPTEYFFNLRGSNALESCDVVFIIGTPQANPIETVKEYNKLAMTHIGPKETYRRTYTKKDGEFLLKDPETGKLEYHPWGGGVEKIPDALRPKGDVGSHRIDAREYQILDSGEVDLDIYYPLPYLDQLKSDSEQYQAIHRARPFLNQKEIYVFGNVPRQIREEFNVISLDKDQTTAYFMGTGTHGVYPLSLWSSITSLYQKNELNSLEIAKELRLYKQDKKSYNTPFITAIIKGVLSPRDVKKIDRLIKANPEITAKGIRRGYKFEGPDKFLEDCIFYAKEGNFINM
ncbi:hypothetical protein [Methanobacterium sp.]|uniref:hypothetical protein n=1 Tax=Methanobacterium sp. TaxID=2164 RepID=UPI0025EE2DD4|nr:hypothetical protein [Methanobacterium sp.]MBI5458939.1 hypothetical protein [Methanobacterium sp.]